MDNYTPGKGILVGKFTEEEIAKDFDKKAVEAKMKETGLKYTNTYIRNNRLIIYVCAMEDLSF